MWRPMLVCLERFGQINGYHNLCKKGPSPSGAQNQGTIHVSGLHRPHVTSIGLYSPTLWPKAKGPHSQQSSFCPTPEWSSDSNWVTHVSKWNFIQRGQSIRALCLNHFSANHSLQSQQRDVWVILWGPLSDQWPARPLPLGSPFFFFFWELWYIFWFFYYQKVGLLPLQMLKIAQICQFHLL